MNKIRVYRPALADGCVKGLVNECVTKYALDL
jgi:hypothetical protein